MIKNSLLWIYFGLILTPENLLAQQRRVELQKATATFSQTDGGTFLPSYLIDGNTDGSGWAIGGEIRSQVVVFETKTNLGYSAGTVLIFKIFQNYPLTPYTTLGKFRLSVTSDPRNTFADGVPVDGEVDATWFVVNPTSATSSQGGTLAILQDRSILASGPTPAYDVYTVVAETTMTNITGIRLDVLTDPRLPHGGPGRYSENGNFVLTEFTLDAKPAGTEVQVSAYVATELCWPSEANVLYQIQSNYAVGSTNWINYLDPIIGNDNEICIFASCRSNSAAFYRVVEIH